MQKISRPRRYVSSLRLYAMLPALRYSHERGAYVLRFVGETRGPVLRKDRRRRQREFTGPDRRDGGVDLQASRPIGSVRRIQVTDAGAVATQAPPHTKAAPGASAAASRQPAQGPANRRRRQHGRQRPPRPHH